MQVDTEVCEQVFSWLCKYHKVTQNSGVTRGLQLPGHRVGGQPAGKEWQKPTSHRGVLGQPPPQENLEFLDAHRFRPFISLYTHTGLSLLPKITF